MGDFADDLMFKELETELRWEHHNTHYNGIHYTALLREYFKGELLWCKKDGNNVLIQDMDNSHLHNSISWIEKLGSECAESLLEMKTILLIEKNKRKTQKDYGLE
jgi:hypothetical protein